MEIVVLGSGTFEPEYKRHCASYFFKIGNEKIVIDFGRGAIDGLLKLKVNLFDIDKIFISHFHADHFSELSSLLHWIYSAPNLKEKYKFPILTIYGPRGLEKRLESLMNAFDKSIYKNKDDKAERIKIVELKEGELVSGKSWKVKGFRVEHSKNNIDFSYRIEEKGVSVCYSGDTGDCKGLRKSCQNTDLAIIEATLPERWNVKSHLTGEQVGKIATECNVKKIVATHVAPEYLKDVRKDIRKHFKGKVVVAKDLMKIRI